MLEERVNKRLEALGKKKNWLVSSLDMSSSTFWRKMSGKTSISYKEMQQLAKALECSPEYLSGAIDSLYPEVNTSNTQPAIDDKRSFGERLRACRRAKDWGQEILAEKLGLPQGKIAAMEAGKHKPNQEQLQHLAEALEIPVEALGANEEFPSKPATQAAQDLDTLIKELASKNPDLVVRLRNTSANVKEMSEEAKQTLADGLKYVLGLAELDDLPRLKRHKER